ncbi:hypothetical protein R50072_07890 [Simiduia litorea]|uniref:hypothetical protein n=1 Tax=Simiduia litorea TaxID=1435348 RepID=UPI0036F2FBF9
MKLQDVEEVIACLGDERRIFRYFKDRYCFDLLVLALQRQQMAQVSVSQLKAGSLARYLQKPILANALKHCGAGVLDINSFGPVEPVQTLPLSITLARWGEGDRGWDQTSRNQCNLVLQLNFDSGHNARYHRLVNPANDYGPFEFYGHPIHKQGRKTLAWVRLDIDFTTGEVLIEEIQNDWLRKAKGVLDRINRRRTRSPQAKPQDVIRTINGSYEDLVTYVETELQPYRALWSEAAMLAAIRFIKDDLGINTVYYHSFDTGIKLKRVGGAPPRSMYTTLPKQFGFELTTEVPAMLATHKHSRRYIKAIEKPSWFRREL